MKHLTVLGIVAVLACAVPCVADMYWDPNVVPDGTITEKDFTLPFGSPKVPPDVPKTPELYGDYSPSIDVERPVVDQPRIRRTSPLEEPRAREPRRRPERPQARPATAPPGATEPVTPGDIEPLMPAPVLTPKPVEVPPLGAPSSVVPPFTRAEPDPTTATTPPASGPTEPRAEPSAAGPRKLGVEPVESEQPVDSRPKFRWGQGRQ